MAASCIVDAGVQLVLEEMMKGVASEGGGGRRRRRRRRRKAETENKRHARTSNKGVIGFLPTIRLSTHSYSPFHLPHPFDDNDAQDVTSERWHVTHTPPPPPLSCCLLVAH